MDGKRRLRGCAWGHRRARESLGLVGVGAAGRGRLALKAGQRRRARAQAGLAGGAGGHMTAQGPPLPLAACPCRPARARPGPYKAWELRAEPAASRQLRGPLPRGPRAVQVSNAGGGRASRWVSGPLGLRGGPGVGRGPGAPVHAASLPLPAASRITMSAQAGGGRDPPKPKGKTLGSFLGALPGFSSARNLVASAHGSAREARPVADPAGAPAPAAAQPQAQGEWTAPWGGGGSGGGPQEQESSSRGFWAFRGRFICACLVS
ncbi:hypothetical protein HPG69_007575 [Diceros bicornis minor]|uniref:Uncharacterized protein n=1 Tax=Diceros bicornis minor TaxID=77932 RepID=A0A7J7EZ69_DICBM|nr:hypothetical protein HPG69_007575 [Diceros bicornis minor]